MIKSGNLRRSSDALEAIWTSLMPKSGYSENYSEDEEVVKLSLLLKSTQFLLTGLRQKELAALKDVSVLKDELQAVTQEKEQFEKDSKNLLNQLSLVKFELQSTEKKAMKYQKEAESATSKWQQLQSKISNEVEDRLNTMFKACLQQNKAVTVQDMMTQMHQETQPQAIECLNDELPPAQAPRLFELGRKQTIQSQTPSSHKNSGDSSPDKSLILNTPDVSKRPPIPKKKLKKDDLANPSFANIMKSAMSSPDEIAPTPPSAEEKQVSKKRSKMRKIFDGDTAMTDKLDGNAAIVYAKDTQDLDEFAHQRSVLKENIIIPETLNPEDCEEEIKYQPTSIKDKENGCGLSAAGQCLKKSPAGTSTSEESLSTPRKGQATRPASPIFNSETKKKGSRSLYSDNNKKSAGVPAAGEVAHGSGSGSNPNQVVKPPLQHQQRSSQKCQSINTSSSFSKNSRFKQSSFQEANEVERSYRKTNINGKRKLSIQPDLSVYLDTSKLNRSKSNRSNSKLSLKKVAGSDLSRTHLSEQDSSHLTDDSDVTMFEPITDKSLLGNVKSAVNSSTSLKDRHNVKDNEQTFYFEPIGASTEKDDSISTKFRNSSKSPTETSQFQFKPPFASTEKQSNFKNPSSDSEMLSDFRPPFASTQKGATENTANLNEFVALLEEEKNLNKTADAENSYDHVPRDYAKQGKRGLKKLERKNLPALECTQCGRYFAAAFGDENVRKEFVNSCSRHRDRTGAGARPKTPPGWWDPGWTSPLPQDANRAQEV